MSLTRRMATAIQAGLEASARRAPAYGVGPPVSVDGFTANSFTRHVPARYTSSCCQMVFVRHHQAALQREVRLALVRRRDAAGGECLLMIGARVVDDVREQ